MGHLPRPPGYRRGSSVCVVFVKFLIVCLWVEGVVGTSHIVFTPLGAGTSDVALLIVPEINLENTAYEELGFAMKSQSPFPLWIAVIDTQAHGGVVTKETLPVLVAETLAALGLHGMNIDTVDIFLAGHGKAGPIVTSYVHSAPELFRGVILFGSYFKKGYKASTFPLPVLILSGDLDGISRITRVADNYQDLRQDAVFDPDIIVQSPLIILDGYNHGVFSSGELPGAMQQLDIDSEQYIDDGHTIITNFTMMFIANTLQLPESPLEKIRTTFREEIRKAGKLMKVILEVKALTHNDKFESYFVRTTQKWLSGLRGEESQLLRVEGFIVGDATDIPPTLMQEREETSVVSFADITWSNSGDMEQPHAPVEIAARMLGPDRIRAALSNITVTKYYTCKDFNYASFMTAYHKSHKLAQDRFDRKHRGVIFHDDLLTQSDKAWEGSRLLVDTVGHELHVTGVSYKTPNSAALGKRAGLFYCKMLPPDRAMEWIYVDSLRRNMPVK
ncbi:uncharacterized protein LOC121381987 [Gigantopelta aegis]|uniref:uncharacterized protein LOC121381987 n=1 Tax=Gigantopelta aegis TaxID=1735272 RepID=UPI001B88DCB4|nr:uncharacterized protein LOC121381987 [Gigantopelta aegis]